VNVPFLLHTVSSFSKETLARTSHLVLQGLQSCVNEPGPLRSEIMTSPDFWAILRALAGKADSAAMVFVILETGTTGSPPAIMADNYVATISLLNEFASVAGRATTSEQKGDSRQRKPRTPKREATQNEVVSRGVKAISLIYDMTARIPQLMKQSHLESNEGQYPASIS
jgi:golgi-specific brefeldin A-resistance guanine nucleotide exchange factor 1